MKKLLITTLLAAFFIGNANAQISIRPEVGMNKSKSDIIIPDSISKNYIPDDFPVITKKNGFDAGLNIDVKLIKGLSLEAGAFYRKMNYEVLLPGIEIQERSYDYGYFPFTLNYDFDLHQAGNIFIGAGGYYGHLFQYKEFIYPTYHRDEGYLLKVKVGNNWDDVVYHQDFGLVFKLGYVSPWGIYLKGQYSHGLKNIAHSNRLGLKNSAYSINIGYDIPLFRNN